jgi:hypothetical protein
MVREKEDELTIDHVAMKFGKRVFSETNPFRRRGGGEAGSHFISRTFNSQQR